MDFRYRLAKKTFKNKKIPQKRAAGMDVISEDQRGDDSSPEISPLRLDRQTITPKPQLPKEEKELSRRDLFSFGNFMKSAADLDVKPIEETTEDGKEEELENSLKPDDNSEDPSIDFEATELPSKKKAFSNVLFLALAPVLKSKSQKIFRRFQTNIIQRFLKEFLARKSMKV